ncbi:glycoside-pentoside-hexuronide (GPH):cation symporter [Clostridium felsineum]|uniref:Symporter YjmB n=1 Tax=Clostridium felsineum TaxID=36839 RepID=A0A1S8LBX3_9CLOT|nr:MFS transporter [Clostridium felsineum]URZ07340.1 putative symporter YjmB [Clostridium felsineum]URZ12371.1 putative symporter YjmB [Clostridium felsineum]
MINKSKKLTLKEKISYGLGDLGNGFMFDLGQAYLLQFYTDVVGIAAAAAGSIFLITKLFDAFMDPLAGTIIDSKKPGKNGKFKAVMLLSSILLAIMTVITFTNPGNTPGSKLAFAYVTYMLWGVLYSFTNVPYGSLGSVITQDTQDRTALSTFRQLGSSTALLITGIVFIPLLGLFGNPRIAYPIVTAIMSIVGVAAFYTTYKNTTEIIVHDPKKEEKITLRKVANAIFHNRALLTLILMTVFSISAYNIKTAMVVYYCKYNLGNAKLVSYVNFFTIGCAVIGVSFLPKLVKLFGKKRTAVIAFSLSSISDAVNFLLPGTHFTIFIILASISFMSISITNGVTWAFVSDSIDYGEWKNGERREGITYSVFNFSRKIAQSIAGAASGVGLAFVGYIANAHQSEHTLIGIKGLLLLYPACATAVAALIVGVLYNLSDAKFATIIDELFERNRKA